MILGGDNSASMFDSVELFNIQTHQSCSFGTMPYAATALVGGALNGVPVLCGGKTNAGTFENRCFKYDKSWKQVN